MIQELSPSHYPRLRPLFQGELLRLVLEAVIAGNSPARVWVDGSAEPTAALLWDGRRCFYLAGDYGMDDFQRPAAHLIARQLLPANLDRGYRSFKAYFTPGDSLDSLPRFFAPAFTEQRLRVLYHLERLALPGWRARIPAGYELHAIDRGFFLLEWRSLERVQREILLGWRDLETYFARGYGCCLARGREIACWCTAEYSSPAATAASIETLPDHQGLGLATLAASAFASHCLDAGLECYWEAWQSNLPSLAIAEKTGFHRLAVYPVLYGEAS